MLFVQKTTLGTTTAGTSQSSGAFAASPTAGNYVVVWTWGWESAAITASAVTCADNATGNTYTRAAFQIAPAGGWSALFYAKVVGTVGSFTPTVSVAGGHVIEACAAEFSGVAPSSPADGAAVGTTGTTGAPAPGSMTFTAGDLIVAVMQDDFSAAATVTTPTGFTSVQKDTDGVSHEVGEGVYALAPSSPTNPTWNSIGATGWGASQLALKAAPGLAGLPLVVRQAVHRASTY